MNWKHYFSSWFWRWYHNLKTLVDNLRSYFKPSQEAAEPICKGHERSTIKAQALCTLDIFSCLSLKGNIYSLDHITGTALPLSKGHKPLFQGTKCYTFPLVCLHLEGFHVSSCCNNFSTHYVQPQHSLWSENKVWITEARHSPNVASSCL